MIVTLTMNPAIDKKLYVTAARLGETNKCKLLRTDFSGKGINVAKNLKVLGCDSIATGFMAEGSYAAYSEHLSNLEVKHDFIKIPNDVRVNIKLIEENGRETEINENGGDVNEEYIAALLCKVNEYCGQASVLCISGSIPGGVSDDIYGIIIKNANERGVKTILDASGYAFNKAVKAAPYAVKPNIGELSEFCGKRINSFPEIKKEARVFFRLGTRIVVVSAGDRGAFFITQNECVHAFVKDKIQIKGTIGAGDAMCAALAASIIENAPMHNTAKLCIAAATASCMEEGTTPGKPDVIKRLQERVVLYTETNTAEE